MKNVLRIFNIILIALSAIAIGFVAFTPLLKMNLDYTVQTTDLENVFKGKLGEGSDSISDEELHDIIYTSIGDDGIKFSLELKLESKGMKKMQNATNEQRIETLYDEVFKPIIKQVIDNQEIKAVINNLARTMAKKMAKKTVKEQIKDHIASADDKENPEFLNNVGITDQFIDDQVDILFDSITKEDATISDVAASVVEVLVNTAESIAINSLDDSYKEGGDNYVDPASYQTDEFKETVETQLKDMLVENNLADENGNILSVDEALALVIEQMMNQASSSSSSSSSSEESHDSLVYAHYEGLSEEEQKTEENKKTLSDVVSDAAWSLINDNVFKDESTKNTIGDVLGMVSQYGMYVQYAFMGMWGILAIFALLKIFSKKKPYVYMGFFWWVAIILFGIIELVFGALLFIKPILTALKGTIEIPAALAGLEFSLYSNLSIVWICNTVLFFFSIAYAIVGHKCKKQYKIEKRAKKAAQAA